jgi:hypothetical protein
MAVRSPSLLAALASGLVVSALSSVASPAWAGDKQRCTEAYEQSQELRRQKKLSGARAALLVCEQECPRILVTDCERWRSEVEAVLPTVRLEATDAQGKPADAGVLVDGVPLVSRVGDDPVAVDPGEHVFRFVGRDGATSEQRVILKEGEQGRTVSAVLGAPASGDSPETGGGVSGEHAAPRTGGERRHIPVASYVLGGVGVVGLAVGTVLTIKGHVDESDLRSSCAPTCSTGAVDSIAHQYNGAWISAGVGLVALGTAVVLWRPWQREPAAPRAASLAPLVTPVVTPTFAGAAARISF